MTKGFRVTILGSGTSTGVPIIGCHCSVCTSDLPQNHRTRASIMVSAPGQLPLVVDSGPEFRLQMLRHRVDGIAGVLYTHTHADHCHGFDDLRAFYFHTKEPVDGYLHESHVQDFKSRFAYAFDETPTPNSRPQVRITTFDDRSFQAGPFEVSPMMLPHGIGETATFRMGRFLYATDFKSVPESIRTLWRGKIDVMVASGVRFHPHPTHSSVPETIALMLDLRVKRGIITHLGHEVEYQRDSLPLPSHIQLAYDGMTIDVA